MLVVYELTGKETAAGAVVGSHDVSQPNLTCPGTFRLTKFEEENVWALATDQKNTLLIAGDTGGYMFVYDISGWCHCNINDKV